MKNINNILKAQFILAVISLIFFCVSFYITGCQLGQGLSENAISCLPFWLSNKLSGLFPYVAISTSVFVFLASFFILIYQHPLGGRQKIVMLASTVLALPGVLFILGFFL